MKMHYRSENGGGARVALCAHPTHTHNVTVYNSYYIAQNDIMINELVITWKKQMWHNLMYYPAT
jgi:hypothetical protein